MTDVLMKTCSCRLLMSGKTTQKRSKNDQCLPTTPSQQAWPASPPHFWHRACCMQSASGSPCISGWAAQWSRVITKFNCPSKLKTIIWLYLLIYINLPGWQILCSVNMQCLLIPKSWMLCVAKPKILPTSDVLVAAMAQGRVFSRCIECLAEGVWQPSPLDLFLN